MKQLDHRRRLIDSFVNAIYLFDDYLVITFNYKEGTKTITYAEIEEAFGSDLSSLTAPPKSLENTEFSRLFAFYFPLSHGGRGDARPMAVRLPILSSRRRLSR